MFLKAFFDPKLDLNSPDAARLPHSSALVVDAKALYDLLHQDELQARLGAEKRTAVEVLVTKQRLVEASAVPRWVSSERQLADGLTKESATQLFADRLRSHKNRPTDDQTYQAARKKDPAKRQASATEFAISRPQALASAMFACCLTTARAEPISPRPMNFVDVALVTFCQTASGLVTGACPNRGYLQCQCGNPDSSRQNPSFGENLFLSASSSSVTAQPVAYRRDSLPSSNSQVSEARPFRTSRHALV